MSENIAIDFSKVSKKFCKTTSANIKYGLIDITKNILGKHTASSHLRRNEFWAVRNIDFKIKSGETLAIVGSNGSGKTTILKLLNGIFMPDTGKITVKGKVGALIAVGAGFNPVLNGRENIYINGTILGMSKKEIDLKFSEIVEYAGIKKFLDTPVKNYSSGMYVRLGFSIAIHSDPDILLVDEILSVGDGDFQKKAYKRIKEMIKAKKTVIFVSHNTKAVLSLCQKALLLEGGQIVSKGETLSIIKKYLKTIKK